MSGIPAERYAERLEAARREAQAAGLDALCIGVGADLRYLTGYEAMPLERLTMLVLPADGEATLAVPRLEAPRVERDDEVFTILPWDETDDPVATVARLVGSRRKLAIGDRTWATFLVGLQREVPDATWDRASTVTGPLRAVKDGAEIEALRAASAAADRVAAQLLAGEIALVGRTEAAVSA
ncbi:MAG TPA: aminopeptidase P family N-terminal domain-containing protein, partial [Candidatus Limnocylindrales bacterium]|nr:aminopeptidase P family N-terminal domain-containing protein [Candidatus Limnocylindrales bacterium]